MTALRVTLRLYALICMLAIGVAACGVSIDNCEQQKDCKK